MKKIALLCALVCAGQLYGMESYFAEASKDRLGKEAVGIYTSSEMLPEIKQQIISAALASSDSVDEAIDAIKKFSVLHRVPFDILFNDLKTFTKVVNLLKEKFFSKLTLLAIAYKLNPAIAEKYDELNAQLLESIYNGNPIEDIIELLNQGADVNTYAHERFHEMWVEGTPLRVAAEKSRVDVVKLLLNSGANPFVKLNYAGKTALDDAKEKGASQEVIELLENAMKK